MVHFFTPEKMKCNRRECTKITDRLSTLESKVTHAFGPGSWEAEPKAGIPVHRVSCRVGEDVLREGEWEKQDRARKELSWSLAST